MIPLDAVKSLADGPDEVHNRAIARYERRKYSQARDGSLTDFTASGVKRCWSNQVIGRLDTVAA